MHDSTYLDQISKTQDAGVDFRKIADLFEETAPRMRILDCGCSGGTVSGALAGRHFVVGVDVLPELLAEASGRGLKPVNADASAFLPFRDASFDLVILGDILEHLVDPEKLVREAVRVLARGGRVIASVPNYYSIVRRIRFLRGKSMVIDSHSPYRSYNYFHLRFFTLEDFEELFQRLGFTIIERSYKWTGVCGYEDRRLKRWWKRFNKLPRGLQTRLTNWRPMLFSHEFALLAERPADSETPECRESS